EEVVSRGFRAKVEELVRRREVAEQVGPRARKHGRDEEQQLVDEAGLEERSGEGRAAFEQQRLDAVRGERLELLLERPAAQLQLGSLRQRAAAEGEPARLLRGIDVARV